MPKQPDIIKSVKKLKPVKDDIIIVTLKGQVYPYDIERIHLEFQAMDFMKGVNLIITTQQVGIKKQRPKNGKHQVFLNNLEYLEYIEKHKGDKE